MPEIHPDATSPSGPTAWHFQGSIASIASSFVRVNDRRFAADELRGWRGRAKWCLLRSCNLRQAVRGWLRPRRHPRSTTLAGSPSVAGLAPSDSAT